MDSSKTDMPIGATQVPYSAQLALEFAVWQIEKAGFTLANGKTAAFWHLVYTLEKHIEAEEPPNDPTE